MKAIFKYPNCKLDHDYDRRSVPVDMYWIETNWGGANYLLNEIAPEQRLFAMDDPEDHLMFYFLLAADLSRILQLLWVWSGSAMNNYKDEFVYFDPFEFNSLEDFQNKIKLL